MTLSRNTLVILLAAACLAIATLGFKLYEDQRRERGVEINVGPRGLSIKEN